MQFLDKRSDLKKKSKKCAPRLPLVMASVAGILRGSGLSRDARSKLPLPTFQIFPYWFHLITWSFCFISQFCKVRQA